MPDAFPAQQTAGVLVAALPPPPDTVIRNTRYYGTVTIDHRAHLALRNACRACHGPGPVTKIVYTPRVAHERCIGCHQAVAKGPTGCKDCHVKPAPAPVRLVAAANAVVPVPPPRPEPNAANVAAALAAFDARKLAADGGVLAVEPFHRTFEIGFVAGAGPGVSFRLASHQNWILVTQSIERMSGGDESRTFGLLGAGVSRPLARNLSGEAIALAGFDVVDEPLVALLPAVGARAGVAWRTRWRFLKQVNASLTGVYDLSTRRAGSREVGGASIYGTVGTGFSVAPR